MKLSFTKMQGIGNDFIVVNALEHPLQLTPAQIQWLADRHFGIGFDQLLVVEASQLPNVDFRYRIFNADGGEVEQCGNGARCFVRYVHDKGLTSKREINVETARGVIVLTLEPSGLVTVNMGPPYFEPHDIPFTAVHRATTYPVDVEGEIVTLSVLSMGNPHAVQVVENVDSAPVAKQGPKIESHVRFPQRVNAGFLQILDAHTARLRVYERGSGETLACGSGACAAVVAGIQRGLLTSPVDVQMRGGQLRIRWEGEHEPVWMSGPAECVFEGVVSVPDGL